MFGNPGDYYFHFTTTEAAFEFILPDRLLRLSPHSVLRDPLEYKEWTFGDFAGGYWKDIVSDSRAVALLGEATDALNQLRKGIKVLALTVDPPDYGDDSASQLFGRGYASARMWEHYADNHAGVCLAFKRDELDRAIKQQLGQGFSPPPGLDQTLFQGEVDYTTSGWAGAAGARGLALSEETIDAQTIGRHFQNHVHEMLFLKTRDWATEYEYRYAAATPGEDYDYIDFGDSLAAAIVGERFPMWQASGAIELCEEADAEAKQLSWIKEGPFVVPLVPWSELEDHLRKEHRKRRLAGRPRPPSL